MKKINTLWLELEILGLDLITHIRWTSRMALERAIEWRNNERELRRLMTLAIFWHHKRHKTESRPKKIVRTIINAFKMKINFRKSEANQKVWNQRIEGRHRYMWVSCRLRRRRSYFTALYFFANTMLRETERERNKGHRYRSFLFTFHMKTTIPTSRSCVVEVRPRREASK